MAKIQKFRAEVLDYAEGAYRLVSLLDAQVFWVNEAAMHARACFPLDILTETGRLKEGVVLDMVAKISDGGQACYYPNLRSYPDSRVSATSESEYATYLLTFIDHAQEIHPQVSRSIVKAIAANSVDLVCELIKQALFNK